MKKINSVNGYRIYPSSPSEAENAARHVAVVARFNEGMDRLHQDKSLSTSEQELVDRLPDNSDLQRKYQGLLCRSDVLLTIAHDEQQYLENDYNGDFTATELHAQRLIACANLWVAFKDKLHHEA